MPGMRSLFTYFLSFIILIFFQACRIKNMQTPDEHRDNDKMPVQKPGSSYKDSMFILFPAAVFFSPDSVQSIKISRVTDPSIFESSLHEYHYQMRNAHQYLKEYWQKITIMDAMNCRYLVFRKSDGGVTIIDLDRQDPCGMFVFDRVKDPLLVDMTNVDTQVTDYFSIFQPGKHE